MSDDKSKRGNPDRRLVSANEPYEMRTLAKQTKLPTPLVTNVTRQVGPSRARVIQKLERMKRNGKK